MVSKQPSFVNTSASPFSAAVTQRLVQRLHDLRPMPQHVYHHSQDGGLLQQALLQEKCTLHHTLPPTASLHAVISNLALHAAPHPLNTLWQWAQALQPNGVVLASVLGPHSFTELSQAATSIAWPGPIKSTQPSLHDWGQALQKTGFALPVLDRDTITLTFSSWNKLLAARQVHGVTNTASNRFPGLCTPAKMQQLQQAYTTQFQRDDGRLPLTIEVIYLHAVQPAPGQPRPLPRGSGRVSILGPGGGQSDP